MSTKNKQESTAPEPKAPDVPDTPKAPDTPNEPKVTKELKDEIVRVFSTFPVDVLYHDGEEVYFHFWKPDLVEVQRSDFVPNKK